MLFSILEWGNFALSMYSIICTVSVLSFDSKYLNEEGMTLLKEKNGLHQNLRRVARPA